MDKGRIVKAISGFFYVQSAYGVISCKGRGILKKEEQVPLVGDEVLFSLVDEALMEGMLEKILPRNNELIRPPIANVDQLLIVISHSHPTPNYVLLDRILVMAESQHLKALLCFNKTDLALDGLNRSLCAAYEKMGYKVMNTSAESGEGLEILQQELNHRTTALAGSSGVGKSTLINSMYPHFSLETGSISEKIQRGRHTTRHSELYQINNTTWIMDTPGFSTLSVDYLEDEEVRDYFRDFVSVQSECRFLSCLHLQEPGCGVKKAVKNEQIHSNRYQNYVKIIQEIRKNRRY